MPKRATPDDENVTVLPTIANSDGAKLRNYLDRIKSVQVRIDKVMENARAECSPMREEIDDIRKEANEAGFARKEFNTIVRKERLELKLSNIAANLDEEQIERFEDMLHALGQLAETPLGQAAAARHPVQP